MAGDKDSAAGAAIYSKWVLALYDLLVVHLSNDLLWRCPRGRLLAWYNDHVSARHLDIGVGTGYYLDRCCFPSPTPQLTLADLNANSLEVASQRLRRYHPTRVTADALQPLPLPAAAFDSIAVVYLLHCLPGTLQTKGVMFRHLRPLLRPGGVLFGATILGSGVPHTWLSRRVMSVYNKRGIFSNTEDTAEDLEHGLQQAFDTVKVRLEGAVALFSAQAG